MLKKGRAPGFPLGPTQELFKFYSEIREEKPECRDHYVAKKKLDHFEKEDDPFYLNLQRSFLR